MRDVLVSLTVISEHKTRFIGTKMTMRMKLSNNKSYRDIPDSLHTSGPPSRYALLLDETRSVTVELKFISL